MPERTVAIVQARMGSTRLPNKVLAEIAGQTVLERVVDRVRSSQKIDEVVIATSVAKQDEVIAQHCLESGILCFRGSEQDVLGRFQEAARLHEADWIVRVNADNPFLAAEFLDELIAKCQRSEVDYASYRVGNRPAMLTAVGFFAEILSWRCLELAATTIQDPHLREHVTLGIYQDPDNYQVHFLEAPRFAEDHRLRLTLDTPEDLAVLREIACEVAERPNLLDAKSLCEFLATNPQWMATMEKNNLAQPK